MSLSVWIAFLYVLLNELTDSDKKVVSDVFSPGGWPSTRMSERFGSGLFVLPPDHQAMHAYQCHFNVLTKQLAQASTVPLLNL